MHYPVADYPITVGFRPHVELLLLPHEYGFRVICIALCVEIVVCIEVVNKLTYFKTFIESEQFCELLTTDTKFVQTALLKFVFTLIHRDQIRKME